MRWVEGSILFALSVTFPFWSDCETLAQTAATSRSDSLYFTAKVGAARTEFSDHEILAATYSDYRVPQGFYKDAAPDTVSFSFINSIGVWRKGPPGLLVCTDNREEAKRWQHMSDSSSSVHRKLLQETETDKFFEFRTEDPSPRHYTLLMRILKCRYLDMSQVGSKKYYPMEDFSGWFRGVFNVRPITKKNVRELGEFMWYIWNRQTYGSRVMSSFCCDKGTEIVHTMFTLRSVGQDVDDYVGFNVRRDPTKRRELLHVTLVQLDYHVSKTSGEIFLDSKGIRTIMVRDNPPEILAK